MTATRLLPPEALAEAARSTMLAWLGAGIAYDSEAIAIIAAELDQEVPPEQLGDFLLCALGFTATVLGDVLRQLAEEQGRSVAEVWQDQALVWA